MNWKVFKRLFSYLKNYNGRFTFAVIAAILGTVFTVFAPILLGNITTILFAGVMDNKWFVEQSGGVDDPSTVWLQLPHLAFGKAQTIFWTVVVLVVMYALAFIFNTVSNRMMARIAASMVKDIRSDIDRKMHRMKLNYYDTHTNGEILSTVTNDVDAINTLLGKNFFQIISAVITIIGILVMLLVINVWLALIAVMMVPVTFLTTAPVMKRGGKNFGAQQALIGSVNGYVEEMYDGHNVVTSFNYQNKSKAKFDALNEELCKKTEKAERAAGKTMPLTQLVNNIGYAASGLVGCLLALNGVLAIGSVQSALQYTKLFQQPFTTFAQMSSQLSSAVAACKRIFGLLDAEEEIPDPESGKIPTLCNGTVEFKNVQFGYNPEKLLMTDVSFSVNPGQKISIVGPT